MRPLIPIEYLNEACFLSLNEDDKKYKMCIENAEDDLSDLLGSEFFDEIVTQYPATLSTDNAALYEGYLKKYLAWNTYHIYMGFSQLNATPTGFREFSDENSSLASDIKLYSHEKNVRAQMVKYRDKVLNFLSLEQSKDSTKYPLYKQLCKEELSFAITAIDKKSNNLLRINKTLTSNE